MGQLDLGLMGRVDAASPVPHNEIEKIKSYRDAVRLCWLHRRSQRMTQQTMAEIVGMHPQHVSDYLCDNPLDRQGKERRDMPAKYIAAFEAVTGNTFITQWLAHSAGLTILESLIADRRGVSLEDRRVA